MFTSVGVENFGTTKKQIKTKWNYKCRVPVTTTSLLFCYITLWCNISLHMYAVSFSLHEEHINQEHTTISVVITEVLQTLPVLWDGTVSLRVKTMMFQRIMVSSSSASSSLHGLLDHAL